MLKIEIDKEKCTKCGQCLNDCLTYTFELDEEGYPKVRDNAESLCIACQHCFSICPKGAISYAGKTPEEASPVKFPKPEKVLDLIKSRRSIRQYTSEEIPEETFTKIKEMLPYIPTGCNFNSLHFSFIESKKAMDDIRDYTNNKILKLVSNKFTAKYAGKFVHFKKAFENGEDIIFRGAPHMIVVSSHIHAPCANVDPIIALSYIELYAQSLGLGTCWCGFAQACFKILPKLSKKIGIPDGYKPSYVMLLGMPSVKYRRNILPEEFPINSIKDSFETSMTWTEKVRRILLNFIR